MDKSELLHRGRELHHPQRIKCGALSLILSLFLRLKAICMLKSLKIILDQVLGGTAQLLDTDMSPREEDRRAIMEGCIRMMPSLASAKASVHAGLT